MEHKRKKSSVTAVDLPIHIFPDILSRLPIKTLFQCRLVCKPWLHLISHPHFIKLHLSRSPTGLLLKPTKRTAVQIRLLDFQSLPRNGCARETQLKLNGGNNYPRLGKRIINSCNGLLCLGDEYDPLYVCNPILGESIYLRYSSYDGDIDDRICALGFSPKNDQYKVVQFFPYDSVAEVYTLGKGRWRNIGKVPFCLTGKPSNAAFLNGALHWLNFDQTSSDLIRCFDFDTEQSRVVPEPSGFGLQKKDSPDHIRLNVISGSLSMCDFTTPSRFDIWRMKDYGIVESWSKEFVIENSIGNRGQLDCFELIVVLKSGEMVLLLNKDAVVLYNPKLGGFKRLNIYGVKSEFIGIHHVPSLVSLEDVAKGENIQSTLERRKYIAAKAEIKEALQEMCRALGQ